MIKRITLGLLTASALATQLAVAGPDCTSEPKENWMSMLEMQKKIVNEYGYAIARFKADDGCYEIYGYEPKSDSDDEMQKVEIYFNPVNGEIVKKSED